jgi:hypothetical protein
MDARMEELLGVRYLRSVGSVTTYLTPEDAKLRKSIWPQENITFPGRMIQAQALAGVEVLATVTLPIVEPYLGYTIGNHFAQLWSNPPATNPGRDPGIVVNASGKGKTVWVAAPIESRRESVYPTIVLHLLRRLLPGPYHFEADTHPAVEMTLFHQVEKQRLIVSLLNAQVQIPAIPVEATVRVLLPAPHKPRRVVELPGQKELPFVETGAYVQFVVPRFDVLAMAAVEYE